MGRFPAGMASFVLCPAGRGGESGSIKKSTMKFMKGVHCSSTVLSSNLHQKKKEDCQSERPAPCSLAAVYDFVSSLKCSHLLQAAQATFAFKEINASTSPGKVVSKCPNLSLSKGCEWISPKKMEFSKHCRSMKNLTACPCMSCVSHWVPCPGGMVMRSTPAKACKIGSHVAC